ncbi:MAG: DUF2291 family protein [Paraglaciecola sp.]|uniref:DUF2291 family protein n=1 Tax=Paraglaciecola sp. TaxID=1920173 RepID=UPI003298F4AE
MSKVSLVVPSRLKSWIIGGVSLILFLYFVPLFSIVSLQDAQQKSLAANFNAATYIESFWQGELQDAMVNAVNAEELLQAIARDPAEAAERFGHRLGLSSKVAYFVKGQGRIVSIEDGVINLSLNESRSISISIDTGPVFGNAVRDGSGEFDIGNFGNTQDFNALSQEINQRIETTVFPYLHKDATVGTAIHFVGGVEVNDYDAPPFELKIVPVFAEVL